MYLFFNRTITAHKVLRVKTFDKSDNEVKGDLPGKKRCRLRQSNRRFN